MFSFLVRSFVDIFRIRRHIYRDIGNNDNDMLVKDWEAVCKDFWVSLGYGDTDDDCR